MLQRIDSPEHVIAFRAVGKVERADYDTVLEPAIAAMIADRGGVRLVYVLGTEYEGYSAGAMWEDGKLGLDHWSKWKRIAVVTDHDWLRRSVGALGWIVPGEVKTFDLAEEQAALDWAAG
jgi:hypothetical protein